MSSIQNADYLLDVNAVDALPCPVQDERWSRMLQLYLSYKEEFSKEPVHCVVFHGLRLGAWCSAQRQKFNSGSLPAVRVARLIDAGFDFNPRAHKRQRMQDLYVAYKKEFEREPKAQTIYMGEALGKWCDTQRKRFKDGSLSDQQVQELQSIGFAFNKPRLGWQNKLDLYIDYKEKYGSEPLMDCWIDGVHIGHWCVQQRDAFRQGRLSVERIKQLQDVGFAFNVHASEWQRKLDLYVAYKQEFRKEPHQKVCYQDVFLGKWCDTQRTFWKTGRLSEDRMRQLQEAGFVFHYADFKWQQKLALYLNYKEEFGAEPLSGTVYRGVRIGSWCRVQRLAFKDGRLLDERLSMLKAAGFVFER